MCRWAPPLCSYPLRCSRVQNPSSGPKPVPRKGDYRRRKSHPWDGCPLRILWYVSPVEYVRERWWPGWKTAAVAAIILVVGPLEATIIGESSNPPVQALLSTVLALAVFERRQAPLLTLLLAFIIVGATAEFSAEEATFASVLGASIASVNVGYEMRPPKMYLAIPIVASVLIISPFANFGSPVYIIDAVAVTVLYGGLLGAGALFRERAEQTESLRELAAQLEAEREVRAQEAVEAERARIARELHDIVSHSISLVVIQLQAVRRRLDPGQEQTAEDLRAIETVGRQAMGEMRRMLGVLRVQGGALELEPQPGLGQLPRLIDQTRAAGLPVDLQVEGEAVPLPPGVDLAGYRIVQEGLTNVLKHAGPAHAQVILRYGDRELDVEVLDDGERPLRQRDGGAGLVGMRERVGVYGGWLEFGPAKPHGFRVAARLPVREEALRD